MLLLNVHATLMLKTKWFNWNYHKKQRQLFAYRWFVQLTGSGRNMLCFFVENFHMWLEKCTQVILFVFMWGSNIGAWVITCMPRWKLNSMEIEMWWQHWAIIWWKVGSNGQRSNRSEPIDNITTLVTVTALNGLYRVVLVSPRHINDYTI